MTYGEMINKIVADINTIDMPSMRAYIAEEVLRGVLKTPRAVVHVDGRRPGDHLSAEQSAWSAALDKIL